MQTQTEKIGVAYYTALGKKDMVEVEKYLHPEIQFTDPQETVKGKNTVLEAARRFSGIFKALTIREHFGSEDRAMIVYEVEIPGLSKKLQAASLLSFQDGLISKIELFYDLKALGM